MPVTDIPSPAAYLDSREFYQKAFYRHKNFTEALMQQVGVTSLSELEDHLLRNRAPLWGAISERAELERQLERAETLFQLATQLQRQRVVEQQAAFDRDFSLLDE
jgi:hypothetical protein